MRVTTTNDGKLKIISDGQEGNGYTTQLEIFESNFMFLQNSEAGLGTSPQKSHKVRKI